MRALLLLLEWIAVRSKDPFGGRQRSMFLPAAKRRRNGTATLRTYVLF
jgi:hypothetical protein